MQEKMLDELRIPAHVAIIMDGNGRWAKARGLSRSLGHQQGVETVKRITEEAARIGVKFLTLYTFSTENWKRPTDEVAALMALILDSLEEEIFMKNNVRFRVIGDTARLPQPVRERLDLCETRTAANNKMTMVIAVSYSARWEITEATRRIMAEGIAPEAITEETMAQHLATSFMPDPDLLIRTGGELRLSNYLLWQCAYSELYFCNTYWPDFDEAHFRQAIAEYQKRQRRYGLTGEQVEEMPKTIDD